VPPLISNTLTLHGRFDIGGFGVSSDLPWQAFPYPKLALHPVGFRTTGYRWLGRDYETGSGASKFRYDIIVHGPQLGLTLSF
jgi:hypothetical protein